MTNARNHPTSPPLSYSAALAKLEAVAAQQRAHRQQPIITGLPPEHAIGKVAAVDHISPESTPHHDTAAMDGFAVRARDSVGASTETPVRFRVVPGVVVAAGDLPAAPGQYKGFMEALDSSHNADGDLQGEGPKQQQLPWCVEIATGAIFPAGFDACIRYEHVTVTETISGEENEPDHRTEQKSMDSPPRPRMTIHVTKPVPPNTNRRLAGGDIQKGQILLRAGEVVGLQHVLPLAAVGYSSCGSSSGPSSLQLSLVRPPRLGILSTGKELLQHQSKSQIARDINGPYLMSAARAVAGGVAAEANFLGTVDDDPAILQRYLKSALQSDGNYDAIISTGGVSMGRFDYIREILEQRMDGAEIVFHGLAMRPGHPVLFALVPGSRTASDAGEGEQENGEENWQDREAVSTNGTSVGEDDVDANNARSKRRERISMVPFFGLPGNPVAVAVCYRFLVVPYLRALQGQEREKPLLAKLAGSSGNTQVSTDVFRHGSLSCTPQGGLSVELSREQSPAKLGPFSSGLVNCWVHLKPGQVVRIGDEERGLAGEVLVECYPFSHAGIC